ncbi:MAG: peptide ligase PGM1-related protein, partial [Dolichospermum sp.]
LMGCLSQFGKLGLTSIGDSPQEAEDIYNKVIKVLDQETSGDNNHAIFADDNFAMNGDGYNY